MDILLASLVLAGLTLIMMVISVLLHWRAQGEQTRQLQHMQQQISSFQEKLLQTLHQGQLDNLQRIQQNLQEGLQLTRENVILEVRRHRDDVAKYLDKLSGVVEQRLSDGFEKTTKTFVDIIKRLAIIDEAQKRITELSTDVVSLQQLLTDKRSRGAFGEVQLSAIMRNVLPESAMSMQHTLSNGRRADCILFLPNPTGNVVIDAKFPLETYRKLNECQNSVERKTLEQQFRIDIRKHINDIAERYIIPGETSDGAIMFLPAEAIFAEIHSNYPELNDYAQQQRVWLVSPTTLMAVLTTARAVLKDDATRQQVHIIQEHLGMLAKDFERFQGRMDNLAKHIKQAHDDVTDVAISARKITSRFEKIERVEYDSVDV